MRAVVIAVKNGRAAVAGKGGTLTYIEDRGYEIGQMLEISAETMQSEVTPALIAVPARGAADGDTKEAADRTRRGSAGILRFPGRGGARVLHLGSSVAAALLVVLIAGGLTANAAPISTVTLDVNPSVSYGLNVFDRVVSAKAYNEEGEELLEGLSGQVFGKRLPDAVEETLSALRDDEYITEEDTPTAATVASRIGGTRRRERLLTELQIGAGDWNREQKGISVTFDAREVTDELSERAKERGVTPGRILLEDMQREREQRREEQPAPQDGRESERPEPPISQDPGNTTPAGEADETGPFRDNRDQEMTDDNNPSSDRQQKDGRELPDQQAGAADDSGRTDAGRTEPAPQIADPEPAESRTGGSEAPDGRGGEEPDRQESSPPEQGQFNDNGMTPPVEPIEPPGSMEDRQMMPETGDGAQADPAPPAEQQMMPGGFSEPPGQSAPPPGRPGGPGEAPFSAGPR